MKLWRRILNGKNLLVLVMFVSLPFLLLWLQSDKGMKLQRRLLPLDDEMERRLFEVMRMVLHVNKTSRSSRTRLLLSSVIHNLKRFNLSYPNEPIKQEIRNFSTPSHTLPEICPEHRGDAREDRVFFNDVYYTLKCRKQSIESLVDILLYTEDCLQAEHLISRIRLCYRNISIYTAVGGDEVHADRCDHLPNGTALLGVPDSHVTWLQLAGMSKNKYKLIGRNMIEFTSHSDLERMLRAMHSLSADVVGGSVRLEPQGRWYIGCYQMVMRNFTLLIHPGHDDSDQSCAYCDYLASPFLVRGDTFYKIMSRTTGGHRVVPFVDFFLHAKNSDEFGRSWKAVVCADVLFHVVGDKGNLRSAGVAETPQVYWEEFLSAWRLSRLILPGGKTYRWSLCDSGLACEHFEGMHSLLPPCCINRLSTVIKRVVQSLNKLNIPAFAVENSVLGALTFHGGLPSWKPRVDLVIDTGKINARDLLVGDRVKHLLEDLLKVAINDTLPLTVHLPRIAYTHCLLVIEAGRISLCEHRYSPIQPLPTARHETRMLINGAWMPTLTNPGLGIGLHCEYSRKRKSPHQFIDKQTRFGGPGKCHNKVPPHACARAQYSPVGNIQFQSLQV